MHFLMLLTIMPLAALGGAWSDVSSGLVSSYPAKTTAYYNGSPVPAYALTLAIDPEATGGFYRAKSTLPSYGETKLEIKNCALYYAGHRLGIVTQLVSGVTYEVLGRVIE